jgi:hypothetical protein
VHRWIIKDAVLFAFRPADEEDVAAHLYSAQGAQAIVEDIAHARIVEDAKIGLAFGTTRPPPEKGGEDSP